MTRVLMVSDVYFPRINGVSTSIATFRHALAARGVEVRLLVPRYGDEANEDGVARVRGRKVPRDPEDRLLNWRMMHAAARQQAADCDLVHVQTPFVAHYAGIAAARALGKPVLLTYHTFFEEYLHHYAPMLPAFALRALARRMSRSQCNAVDGVIVPSTAMRDRLTDYGVSRPLHVLPTGIPLQDFSGGDGAEFRRRYQLPQGAPVALFIGRVAHEKNIGLLLQVTERMRRSMPDFILLIAGEGPALVELQRDAQRRGLAGAVRFLGYLDRQRELPACYAAADVFTFASRTETQGLVLLEAMAAGLPAVAVAEMGTADILAGERGARIAPADADGFAAVLSTLLRDVGLRARLAEEARSYAAEWGDDIMAARLAALYRQTLTAQPQPALQPGTASALRD